MCAKLWRLHSCPMAARLVGDHEVAGPGGGDGRRVLPGKERRDEQAGDLVVCQEAPSIHLEEGGFMSLQQHHNPGAHSLLLNMTHITAL